MSKNAQDFATYKYNQRNIRVSANKTKNIVSTDYPEVQKFDQIPVRSSDGTPGWQDSILKSKSTNNMNQDISEVAMPSAF